MTKEIDLRQQILRLETELNEKNERLFDQSAEIEELEAAKDRAMQRAILRIQDMRAASYACFIFGGFFAARAQVYATICPDPINALIYAGISLLTLFLGNRLFKVNPV